MSKFCSLCKAENDDENLFCNRCGNPLEEKKAPPPSPSESGIAGPGEIIPQTARKPNRKKWFLIPLVLVVAILITLAVSYREEIMFKKGGAAFVDNYLSLIKKEQYGSALKLATGKGLNPDWEAAFQDMIRQLTPEMPQNEDFQKSLINLSTINGGIKKYYYINRKYPQNLEDLTPVIISEIPPLPLGGEYGYEVDEGAENYTVYVKGNLFKDNGMPENYPLYSRRDRLQAPGFKKIFGQFRLLEYKILSTETIGKTARVKVSETYQYGPGKRDVESVYVLRKSKEGWIIDTSNSSVTPTDLSIVFTQMEEPDSGKKEKDGPKTKAKRFTMPIGMMLLTFSNIADDSKADDSRSNLNTRKKYQLIRCRYALEEIHTALERYRLDNDNKYPLKLSWLTPQYIGRIPENPVTLQDDFSEGYEVSDNQDAFTVYPKGTFFKDLGIGENFPKYSSFFRFIESEKDLAEKIKIEALKKIEQSPTPISENPNKNRDDGKVKIEKKSTPSSPEVKKETPSGGQPSPGVEKSENDANKDESDQPSNTEN